MKRIWIILLQYTNKYSADCLRELQDFVQKNLKNSNPIYIVVDNSINCDLEAKLTWQTHLISGDQTNWEFSGYDKGIHFLRENFEWHPDDLIIVANDTFNRHYGDAYLKLYSPQTADNFKDYFVSGYKDEYPEPVSLNGLSFQRWFRSSFLISNLKTISRIGPFQIPFETSAIFADNFPRFFNEGNLLSENYKTFIRTWLFDSKQVESFKHEWHSKKPLDEANYEFLKNKARSILAEHYFSVRIQRDSRIQQHYIN